ncbi:MAG TPA: hypothetical protein VHG09_11040 [Longimicrobiales bacterium]|nr:hypothetical protein [Longimicrobiales bacterium]
MPGVLRTMVLRQGVRLAAIGIAVGIVAAIAMGRVMANLLFGVQPLDIVTFVGGTVVFLAVATLACLIPAQRAASIPPSQALRE